MRRQHHLRRARARSDGVYDYARDELLADVDARVASFVWMNDNLSLTLRLHVPVAPLPDARARDAARSRDRETR